MEKEYLGDGVYAVDDGFQIILTVDGGTSTPKETIYLDVDVIRDLEIYIRRWKDQKEIEK